MLIERLKDLQGKLTNQEFADKIGVHRVTWLRIKSYRKPPGRKFLLGVKRAYPELQGIVDSILTTDVLVIAHTEKHYNGKTGRLRTWLRELTRES